MKYTEIQIETTHSEIDLVSDAMFSAGAEGVEIIDSEDVKDILADKSTWDYVDNSLLKTSDKATAKTVVDFENKEFINKLSDELKFLNIKNCSISTKVINGEDWENEWKKYFNPIKTHGITVVPSWIDYQQGKNEKIIKIDPGMAFGTGEHATTRMCLEMMNPKGKSVMDIGCGSGILGISSAILGATSVYMCDLDSKAVEFSKRNAEANNVECVIECADLLEKSDMKADLIFANITADILIRLSKSIIDHLNDGGEIILSGIIDLRELEVKDAYEALGLRVIERRAKSDWRGYKLKWN
ncbi:MAG: 50S ribosomal protein L11 methyltransferase [Clostridia bacterium]|nr:50S ribosomal protein L11 methyltransferase [Clostridia bacterium]